MPQTLRVSRRVSTRSAALLLAALLLTSCSGRGEAGASPSTRPTPAPTTAPAPRPPVTAARVKLVWRACAQVFECTRLPARGLPGGLALTRLVASRPAERIGSLVVNPGGPGGSAVDYLQGAYASLPRELRRRFDLVAFDPRGVGHSGAVRCLSTAGLDAFYALDPSPDTPRELEQLVQGSRRFAAGCEQRSAALLRQVSTVQVADDLEAVRAAVGDAKLSYLGYSYGTAIGAAYLDRYPTHVRVMVLDGALDPRLSWDQLLEGQSKGFDDALTSFLADCEQTRCAFRDAVAGDLGAAYDRLAARVERTPLRGHGARTVGPGELSLGVGEALYDQGTGWPTLAEALAMAEQGDGGLLLDLSDSYLERTAAGYDPLGEANLAVNCVDRPYPTDTQAYAVVARRIAATAPRFGPAIAWSALPCAQWPVPATARPAPVTAPGAPPVVVIGTTGDPATPYAWAVGLAHQLRSGVLLTHVGEGHTVYTVDAPKCILGPVTTYLLTARAPADARCVNGR